MEDSKILGQNETQVDTDVYWREHSFISSMRRCSHSEHLDFFNSKGFGGHFCIVCKEFVKQKH